MADYRVIKKSDDKYHPEVRKKLFWHNLKGHNDEKDDGVKISFDSFSEARDYVSDVLKKVKK